LKTQEPSIILSKHLVSISSGIILWTDDQTSALLCASINGLDDVDQLLFILQNPVKLVIVTGTEIAHHVFVAEEKHYGDGVVEFIHLLEVWDLVEITDVDDGKVLDAIGDT